MKNVEKLEIKTTKLPEQLISEDRGLDNCAEPILVLADVNDDVSWKNDITGIALAVDSIVVFLETKNGDILAPGMSINFANQQADGFVIDWRQLINNDGTLKTGCYKVRVDYIIDGISGSYYWGSYDLKNYNIYSSEGTVKIEVEVDSFIRKDNIDYKNSGFKNSIRFQGFFGNNQAGYNTTQIIKENRITEVVRKYDVRSFTLSTGMLLCCITQKIDTQHLLSASNILISDYNKINHLPYKNFPVVLSPEKSPEYTHNGIYASITAYFSDKKQFLENKFSNDLI